MKRNEPQIYRNLQAAYDRTQDMAADDGQRMGGAITATDAFWVGQYIKTAAELLGLELQDRTHREPAR